MDIDEKIRSMQNGDISVIEDVINNPDEYPFLQMNALIYGTKLELKTESFLAFVSRMKESDVSLLNVQLSKVASASECLLNGINYDGDDRFIKGLTESRFEF